MCGRWEVIDDQVRPSSGVYNRVGDGVLDDTSAGGWAVGLGMVGAIER